MSSNKIGLIILACVLVYAWDLPKIQQESLGMIILTIAVGYSVTKNMVTSVSVGLILGAIFTSLTSVNKNVNVKILNLENQEKKKTQ